MSTVGTINLYESAFPDGHALAEFAWGGRLDNDGQIYFDFHLKTIDIHIDVEEEDIQYPEGWKPTIVFGGECILSSSYYGTPGILVDTGNDLLRFNALPERLSADPLPFSEEEFAFHIYLQGHDSCADHHLRFLKTSQGLDLEWTGKIELTYYGGNGFVHDFKVLAHNIQFDGFYYPVDWTKEAAAEMFKAKVAGIDQFEFVDINPAYGMGSYKLVPVSGIEYGVG
ncbi:hypothetical protein [Chitinophaga rhizophila]|uniref:Uncharacterized protein n=1 Tax=Chitinophaga rhizophila TaxID=2866212 RepID=A0ABS7G9Z7_9BACT|nr:hypothetical protein [Chitinophaga rhizophila]MBW8684483.1 hypothetical protein [Chitinophaga rhizophila]